MKTRTLVLSLLALLSLFTSACRPRAGVVRHEPYFGPTQSMPEVVAEINANNAALPTLWARHEFDARIVDERKESHFVNGDGVLLYKAPSGLRLVGNKDIAGAVFEIGSTEDRYYLRFLPPGEKSVMWWGWYRNLGKPCVDSRTIPIHPDQILQVLGIATINTNFLEPPVATMRFNNYAFNGTGAYMFTWNVPMRDRWAAQKEIWYDRETKLPRAVLLFDENGRIVLEAKLSDHAPVELPNVPRERWPKVARSYELFFPDTGSTMKFKLDEVAPERKGVPTRMGIAFPSDPKVEQVIQLDADCAAESE